MCRSRRSSRIASIRIWSPRGSSTYRSGCERRSTRPASPSSAPAKALAARRLPTPAGPCRRYACAGPSRSAAPSRRFASACSGTAAKASMDLLGEVGRGLGAVERLDALREDAGELAVGAVDLLAEGAALALDPVTRRAGPRGRLVRIDEEQERAVGQEAADRVQVQLEHALDPEPAREALVGKRRVEVAVAEHGVAAL